MELQPERFAPAGFAALTVVPADGPTLSASLWSAHPDVFGRVDARDLREVSLMLRAGNYVLCSATQKRRCETALEVQPGGWSALTLDTSSAETIVARPGTRAPELEARVPDTNCSACHMSALGGGG